MKQQPDGGLDRVLRWRADRLVEERFGLAETQAGDVQDDVFERGSQNFRLDELLEP